MLGWRQVVADLTVVVYYTGDSGGIIVMNTAIPHASQEETIRSGTNDSGTGSYRETDTDIAKVSA